MGSKRPPRSLKRKIESRPERKTIVIFCEGKNSEPNYVNGLKRLPHVARNTAINIEVDPEQGVPLTLVQRAVARLQESEVDECWCVFDVEWPKHHPNLDKALDLAQAHGVRLAISNPCFELWLILHHEALTRFMDTPSAESYSRSLDKRAGKTIDASLYMPSRVKALEHATQLTKMHERNGSKFPQNNPSTSMGELLVALEGESLGA